MSHIRNTNNVFVNTNKQIVATQNIEVKRGIYEKYPQIKLDLSAFFRVYEKNMQPVSYLKTFEM
jgi:hypothetical protein